MGMALYHTISYISSVSDLVLLLGAYEISYHRTPHSDNIPLYGIRILSTYQQASGNVFEVFDELMDAYENLGSRMPSLKGWEKVDGEVVQNILWFIYEDILEFHREAMKIFRRPGMWSVHGLLMGPDQLSNNSKVQHSMDIYLQGDVENSRAPLEKNSL